MDNLIMWTAQTQRVWDTLERDGVYYVKKRYIEEKYQETAWIFREAYGFFNSQAVKMIPRPSEAESPVWLFHDKKWAVSGSEADCRKVVIPRGEVILFDLRKWSRVLNLSYIGTEQEERAFQEELERQGIACASDVFEKPYYPMMKAKIRKSWERLFWPENLDEQYVQGAVWRLKKEWVMK